MPFKSGAGSGAVPIPTEWFSMRYARARALVPAANFDTIVGFEFDETITVEAVETSGVFTKEPSFGVTGIVISCGDIVDGGSVRWQPTGLGSVPGDVRDLTGAWYAAALALPDGNVLNPAYANGSFVTPVELRLDNNNRVRFGVIGSVDASSWVLQSVNAGASVQVVAAQAIGVAALWRLFEVWCDGTVVTGAVDGEDIEGTIAIAAVPTVQAAISCMVQRGAPQDPGDSPARCTWDKFVLVTTSPAPGSA